MLKCTVCGGQLVMDPSQEFSVCENCGMKFTLEVMREMAQINEDKMSRPKPPKSKPLKESKADQLVEEIKLLKEKGLDQEARGKINTLVKKHPTDYRSFVFKAQTEYDDVCVDYLEDCEENISYYKGILNQKKQDLSRLEPLPNKELITILEMPSSKKAMKLSDASKDELLQYENLKKIEMGELLNEREKYSSQITSLAQSLESDKKRVIDDFMSRLKNNDLSVIDNFYTFIKNKDRSRDDYYEYIFDHGRLEIIHNKGNRYFQTLGKNLFFFKYKNGVLIQYIKNLIGGKERKRFEICDIQCSFNNGKLYISEFTLKNTEETIVYHKFSQLNQYKKGEEYIYESYRKCKIWYKFPFGPM